MQRNADGSTLADALIGAAAGGAAVWVMDRLDWFAFEHEDPRARKRTQSVRPGGMDPAHVTADKVARAAGSHLRPREENPAGKAIHYSFGIMPGALYGALRHNVPGLDAGRGSLFGIGLFVMQDEGLNALSGLSARPDAYPWQAHARGLIAHAVYGVVLDTALRAADRVRGRNDRRPRPHSAP